MTQAVPIEAQINAKEAELIMMAETLANSNNKLHDVSPKLLSN